MKSKTILYSDLKYKAIKLRLRGKMYSEICNDLGYIPKSTMSHWFRDVELTDAHKERIKKIMTKNGSIGRYIGAQKSHQRRLDRLAKISDVANKEYDTLLKDPLFLAGLLLYLAEGSKKTEQFNFMNSD